MAPILGAVALLLLVVLLDASIRRGYRTVHVKIAGALLAAAVLLTAASLILNPQVIAGILLALACANALIAFQRARSFREMARVEKDTAAGGAPAQEAPYEQFVNTFLAHFDRGDADAMEFMFRNWRMEVLFKKGETALPVIDTPFHMLIQIKRLFDAATVKNPKTGESKLRYVARGVLYEFSSEDIGGSVLRLRLNQKRAAEPHEIKAFDRLLSHVR